MVLWQQDDGLRRYPTAWRAAVSLDAAAIHTALANRWPDTLAALGIAPEYLRNRHGPCPACGGKDRYRFDNRRGRGDFYCNGCGAGDGFVLLQRVYGWRFSEARRAVIHAAGLDVAASSTSPVRPILRSIAAVPAKPKAHIRDLVRDGSLVETVPDAVEYLRSRRLWPLPAQCSLRARTGAGYWHEGKRVGRFSALIASIRDVDSELVTAHVTYLNKGRKLTCYPPRKVLSPVGGHQGCAVQLLPVAGEVLGIAEGIETALAAAALHDGLPTWAAISAALLAQWQPPRGIREVLIFTDRDDAGLKAGWKLAEKIDGRVTVELRTPEPPARDWADVLQAKCPP